MDKVYKIIISIIMVIILVGGGFYFGQLQQDKTGDLNLNPEWRPIIKNNCEQSGGVFVDDKCSCPAGFQPDMYDKTSGYCATDAGTAGGKLGEDMAEKYNCKVELKKCKAEINNSN